MPPATRTSCAAQEIFLAMGAKTSSVITREGQSPTLSNKGTMSGTDLRDRIGGALWGLFIADALAMPSHWYYGGSGQVARDYQGPLKTYAKPVTQLPGSIMNLSNTGGGGRGSDSGSIVGDVINHGKKQYWTRTGSYHYHCTLAKGENTLEAQLVRVLCRSIVEIGTFDEGDFLKRYIDFMTTPGTHNDCYVGTCHRMFFANLVRGLPPEKCADNDGHNVDVIDGLILPVPVLLATMSMPLTEATSAAVKCASVTRESSVVADYTNRWATLLRDVVQGAPVEEALQTNAGRGLESVVRSARSRADPVVA